MICWEGGGWRRISLFVENSLQCFVWRSCTVLLRYELNKKHFPSCMTRCRVEEEKRSSFLWLKNPKTISRDVVCLTYPSIFLKKFRHISRFICHRVAWCWTLLTVIIWTWKRIRRRSNEQGIDFWWFLFVAPSKSEFYKSSNESLRGYN